MAKVQSVLASHIISEHFGEMVNKVSSYLMQSGVRCLNEVVREVDGTREEVKKALMILIKHNIVTYTSPAAAGQKRKPPEYKVDISNILKRKRYPKYVYGAKVRFGDVAELVVEALLLNGSDILSHVSKNVAERLDDESSREVAQDEELVIAKCKELIKEHFLIRVKNPNIVVSEEATPEEEEQGEQEKFAVPPGIGVKRKTDGEESCIYEDEGVYWHINFERFDMMFLDQAIISATTERVDLSGSKIVSTMLKMTELERTLQSISTRSISIYDIMKALPDIPKLNQQELHQYLSLLSDEKTGGFVSKTDESSGGMYSVDIKKSIQLICQSACSTIVQERFGSKACRVFRLLIQKKLLEQKQIGELAMIPFKEVKELLYKLFEERFLMIQEVSKLSDYAPSNSFYLFGVDMSQVSRLLLSRCYQTMGNLMTRRTSEMEEHKRLLEKNEKIESILNALQSSNEDAEQEQQVIAELEELITPTEKQQLEKLKIDLNRLENGEIQVEDTVFILQNYINHF